MENTYYTDGLHFRRIIDKNSFMQVMPGNWGPCIDMRYYKSGIEDCFDYRWTPCTADDFVKAYVEVINRISAASGIEHLPLILTETNQNY